MSEDFEDDDLVPIGEDPEEEVDRFDDPDEEPLVELHSSEDQGDELPPVGNAWFDGLESEQKRAVLTGDDHGARPNRLRAVVLGGVGVVIVGALLTISGVFGQGGSTPSGPTEAEIREQQIARAEQRAAREERMAARARERARAAAVAKRQREKAAKLAAARAKAKKEAALAASQPAVVPSPSPPPAAPAAPVYSAPAPAPAPAAAPSSTPSDASAQEAAKAFGPGL